MSEFTVAGNLYVHFPFCRNKCSYCALHSRAGAAGSERSAYIDAIVRAVSELPTERAFKTVYFGGGSPAVCGLAPVLAALSPRLSGDTEFTVELHPDDVQDDLLHQLADGGVNRISMGVQSLDDAVLASMGRGYTVERAEQAFAAVKRRFDNAGIDLIVGYPGDRCGDCLRLRDWGLRHCSVYSLQNERGLANVPDDDWTLDKIREVAAFLGGIGLERYEISNYAIPGSECRHNLAVWRGEDYIGIGEGASGRIGRRRTLGVRSQNALEPFVTRVSEVTSEEDEAERRIFRLRTRDGLDASDRTDWQVALDRFCREGLVTRTGDAYRLTARGAEVCDTILAELV